jgi:hypothetical protein
MVLCLAFLLGTAAVVLDGGMLLAERRRAQATADAAALAAAADLFKHYATNNGIDMGSAKTSALTTANANGYSNDGTTSVVTVRVNPENYLGGPNAGTVIPAGYAEVTVKYNQDRYFSTIWGTAQVPVPARSVARGQWVTSDSGILALHPHAAGAFTSSGKGVTVTGSASVVVNSDNSKALINSGSGVVSVTGGGAINVTGNYQGSNFSPLPTTGVKPTPDPYAYLPMPDPISLGLINRTYSGGSMTLNPGVYQGGIVVSGDLTLNPGIYFMKNGPFDNNKGYNVTGNGVLIYSDQGDIIITGNGDLKITPLTSGPYKGFSLMLNRSASKKITIIANGTSSYVGGTIYGANADIVLSGTDRLTVSQLVGLRITSSGKYVVKVIWDGNTARTPLIGLVE